MSVMSFLLISSFMFFQGQLSFSFENDWDLREQRETSSSVKHAFIASGETLLSNGVVMLFNRYVTKTTWSTPTAEAVMNNFSEIWRWEKIDGFLVNQFFHPYQGAYYFNSGRVNGFGFYGSVFFNVLGSFTWEAFGESKPAAMNDFYTTVIGAASMGEMLYRLYIEACSAGVPPALAFFINPVAGFHRLVTGWQPPVTSGNLYRFEAYLGTGYAQNEFFYREDNSEVFSFKGIYPNIGINIIYGDPFYQNTIVPYRHFEYSLFFGMNPGKYKEIRAVSDGYLFSFSPVQTNKNMLSTGISAHLDFVSLGKTGIHDATIDQFSNALNWSVKYQHLFSQKTALQVKGHAGFSFLSVSNFYLQDEKNTELKNYGYGFNAKRFYIFEMKKIGRFEVSRFSYLQWTYPGLTPLSKGYVNWQFTDIGYFHYITNHFSLGIIGSFARERGVFEGFADTYKKLNSVRMYFAYRAKDA